MRKARPNPRPKGSMARRPRSDPATKMPPAAASGQRRAERTCIVTRQSGSPSALIRFVADPQGRLVPDLKAELPGRGAWVGVSRACVQKAVSKGLFSRALKTQLMVPGDLAEQVERLLRKAALGRLGLARKAGLVVLGFAKVEAAIIRGGVAALVEARDGAPDGRRQIERAVRRAGLEPAQGRQTDGLPIFACFDGAELDLALGRTNAIHAAVLEGAAGSSFIEAAWRLCTYGDAADQSGEPAGQVE